MTSSIPNDINFPKLSGTTDGVPTLVVTATTASAAQTVHTAAAGTDDVDFVTIWGQNTDAVSNRNVTLEADSVQIGPVELSSLAAPTALLTRFRMNSAKILKVYASNASDIVIWGEVTRIEDGAL